VPGSPFWLRSPFWPRPLGGPDLTFWLRSPFVPRSSVVAAPTVLTTPAGRAHGRAACRLARWAGRTSRGKPRHGAIWPGQWAAPIIVR
jgi:hypothetical protein